MSNEELAKPKKAKKSAGSENPTEAEDLKAAKKVKKRKKSKIDAEGSNIARPKKRAAETVDDTVAKPPKKAKKEKAPDPSPASEESEDTAVVGADVEEVAPENPLAIDNFPLSASVKAALKEKQITALFDIQAQTLSHVLAGKDLLGRARTGCGKTLAFVLPIVETLAKHSSEGRPAWGRSPRVIVLAPTRELAKQVHADFDYIGKVYRLSCACIYGGAPYGPQENMLRRGADVVVGTPGRVKDMLERGILKLADLKFRVLDECDEMLNMGFVEDVEKILNAGGGEDIQTLLFSATLPPWVKDIQQRFLKPDFKLVDLVGNERQKASTSVRHLLLPCHWKQRESVAGDCVRTYGAMGRTIVFTDTKRDANEMAIALESLSSRPLHGDIPQSVRETTLAGFRAGRFKVLVATDVAARGLDISGVELVLQCEPPKDPENYIHRSGRTGRAGCTGISLTLVDRKKQGLIPFIERRAGLKFERVGAPQPADMAGVAGTHAAEALKEVDEAVVPLFREAAGKLLEEFPDPAEALARALAKVAGHTKLQVRSLMDSRDNHTTLMFHSNTELLKPGFVYTFLKRKLPSNLVEELKGMAVTKDDTCAVFDVPSQHVKAFLESFPEPNSKNGSSNLARGLVSEPYLSAPTKLPEMKPSLQAPPYSEGTRYGGGARGGRFSQSRRGDSQRGGFRSGPREGGFAGGHRRGRRF